MKILFLTSHFNTGGITSYLLSLTSALTQKGHQIWVASAGGNCETALEDSGGRHINLGFRTKSEVDLRIYLKLGFLKRLIEQEGIDVIHSQTRVTQVMGYWLSRLTKKAFVTTCHGFFKPRFSRRMFPCWGTATIAISQPVKDHLINDFLLPPEKVYLIANGIDCGKFMAVTEDLRRLKRQQWKITSKNVVGIIARLSDVKGIDILLTTMPMVLKKHPDTLLMVVGEGPEKERLRALTGTLKLKDHVRFESIVNQTAEVLPLFDVFVMPSRQEGLGLAAMEAQACALPVIASRVGGLIDLIEDGKTGYLVAPENPKVLAKKIIDVLDNPAQAKQVGQTARQIISEKFSLDRMASATEKVYEQYSRC
jgi:glycosyltransferase involved in cell wall biosynthesis